jgi:hypothetical protein
VKPFVDMLVPSFVLKGQHSLAQGKRRRSVALGKNRWIKIVRARMVIKELIIFRTKGISPFKQWMFTIPSEVSSFVLNNLVSRTIIFLISFPQGVALGWNILTFQADNLKF